MSSNQERVFILKASEIDRLVAYKQTEALKTIFSVAKENPTAGWNELILEAVNRLQSGESSVGAVEEEKVEPVEPDFAGSEPETEDTEPEVEHVEDDVDSVEAAEHVLTEEEEEIERVKAFRENDDSLLKTSSIFDE